MLVLHVASRFKRSFKKMPARVKEDFAEKIEVFKSNRTYVLVAICHSERSERATAK